MSLANKMARQSSQGGMAGRVQSGDPGLFGSLLGAAKGFVTGGPVGAVSGAVSGWRGGSRPAASQLQMPQMPGVRPVPGFRGGMQRLIPGGATGYEPTGQPPKGMRLNKTGYFLKDGTYVPPGTKYVKIRRRNPLNPKALSRAISRIESGKNAASKLSRITIRKKKCG